MFVVSPVASVFGTSGPWFGWTAGFEEKGRGGRVSAVHSDKIFLVVCIKERERDSDVVLAIDEPTNIQIVVVFFRIFR